MADEKTTKEEILAAIEAWKESKEQEERSAIRKRAAETNTVDNTIANAWLKQHWPHPRKCGVCGQSEWGMTTQFAHVSLSLLSHFAPVRTFPCVVITCRTCGNTLFFNAVIMKLLPDGAE